MPTRKKPKRSDPAARTRVPCLTLCCHAEAARIGERALLRGLLVRSKVALSRVDLAFAQPGSPASELAILASGSRRS